MVTPRWLFVTRFKNSLATVVHFASEAGDFLQECHWRTFETCLYSNISHPLLKGKLTQLVGIGLNVFMLHDFKPTDLLQKNLSYLNRCLCEGLTLFVQGMSRKNIFLGNPRHTFASLSWSSLQWLINLCLRQGGNVHQYQHLSIDTWEEEEHQCVHHYQHLFDDQLIPETRRKVCAENPTDPQLKMQSVIEDSWGGFHHHHHRHHHHGFGDGNDDDDKDYHWSVITPEEVVIMIHDHSI